MSQLFLVEPIAALDADEPFARIAAPDAATAVFIFVTLIAPTDAVFLGYVYATSLTLSFAEYFWIQTDAEDALYMAGALPFRVDVFAARVRRFFGAHRDYADRYLAYYVNDAPDAALPPFPDEMLAYIWLHTGYSPLRALPVGEG